jgi:hypothetical protein
VQQFPVHTIDSPALKLGFKNFPMSDFGLTPKFPARLRDAGPAPPRQPTRGNDNGGAIGCLSPNR